MSDKTTPNPNELHRFDGRRLIMEMGDVFMSDYYKEFLPDIETILKESKDPKYYKDPAKHLGLQIALLKLLQPFEKASSEGKREARKSGDEALAVQSKRNRYIAKAYKEIADGMAWRTLGYDRFTMRILSQGRYSGHTWGKDVGQDKEIKRARAVVSKGAFVLVNDVANCLRIGDLVCFKPALHQPYIIEVKQKEVITAGSVSRKLNKGKALDVQEERIIQAQLALSRNIMPMMGKAIPVTDISPNNHDVMAGISAVMKKAATDGVSYKMVTPYMHVEATDIGKLAELKDAKALKAKLDSIKQPPFEPIMQHSNYDRLVHTVAGEMIRNAPPYTVYPLPIKQITKLITGEVLLTVTIYREPLEEAFRKLGWELIIDYEAIDKYAPVKDSDIVKDFSGRVFMPFGDDMNFNDMIALRNPSSGFRMTIGDLLLQMGSEFTTAQYVASVATAVEKLAELERPKTTPRWPNLKDARRWK